MRLCLTLLLKTEQQVLRQPLCNDFITHCSFCWRQKQKARHEQKDVMDHKTKSTIGTQTSVCMTMATLILSQGLRQASRGANLGMSQRSALWASSTALDRAGTIVDGPLRCPRNRHLSSSSSSSFDKVGVIGLGLMGHGICQVVRT